MVSLLSRGVGLLVKSLAGLSCTQATSSLPEALSAVQVSATRWFSKQQFQDGYPRRPLTSYFRYMNEHKPALRKQYPDVKMTEIVKMTGLGWRGLSESAKKPYVEAANEDRFKYRDELRKYKEKLSPLELQIINEKRKRALVKRQLIRRSRELTLLGKPKGSRNAYNIFLSENFQEAKGLASLSVKMKTLHEDFKRLTHSQRQMYDQLAQDDKIRYENEMKAWEKQMLEIGRVDLLRYKEKQLLIKSSAVMREAQSKKELPKKVTKPAGEGKGR